MNNVKCKVFPSGRGLDTDMESAINKFLQTVALFGVAGTADFVLIFYVELP